MRTRLLPRSVLLVAVLVTASLVHCSPVLAQSVGAEAQYVEEGVEAATNNAGPGTDAVNEAMAETGSSAGPSPSSPAPSPPTSTERSAAGGAEGAGGGDASGAGPDSITELPETGGAPLATLCSGILLVVTGSLVYRPGRR